VTDDIRALTARLADEPGSLAFLELAEALRRRGQLEAAYKVARGGVSRYPGLADAHDLLAHVLSDQGDLAGAFDAWASALQLDPMRTSALKGIAFLYFRAGESATALEHLQRALEADPDDPSIPQAIARLAAASRPGLPAPPAAPSHGAAPADVATSAAPAPSAPAPSAPVRRGLFDEVEGGAEGLLLLDVHGLRLGGTLVGDDDGQAGDRVAAQLAGLSREAARATRLLGLGAWHSIAVEAPDGQLFLTAPTADTVLLAARDLASPPARVALLADRAARAARTWLEAQG
jgi:tetratricopeptide (TPR) repeat protein